MRMEVGRLADLTVPELLQLHAAIGEELRVRRVARSANGPTGDWAEALFCRAFNWDPAPNAERGYDARDANGTLYQIKGRRIHRRNPSRQLSALRNLDATPFHVLACVLFDDDFRVLKAALVPLEVVRKQATFVAHTNSHRFILRDSVWVLPGVIDVTEAIRSASLALWSRQEARGGGSL